MKKLNHTKGPWVLMLSEHDPGEYDNKSYRLWELEGDGKNIIDAVDYTIEMTEPDARLIAASPIMLDSLIQAAFYLDSMGEKFAAMPLKFAVQKATGYTWQELFSEP